MSLRPFFDPFLEEPFHRTMRTRFTSDIHEEEDKWEIDIECPGLRKEDVQIELDGNDLIISGERRKEEEKPGRRTVLKEREVGKFTRRFTLPSNCQSEQVSSKMENGILRVNIPKKRESPGQRRRITIE
ncbi:hypothetical protein P9112_013146 [Eukaryota sp. TZLM1-RC]